MILVKQKKEPQISPPPPDWMGSLPEWYIFFALLKLGQKGKFTYQSSRMGGRQARGGVIIDFFFPDINLAINVQSLYYHYRTAQQRMNDQLQRAQLEGMGIKVIYIMEENALANPVYYASEALRGIQH